MARWAVANQKPLFIEKYALELNKKLKKEHLNSEKLSLILKKIREHYSV